MALTSVNWNRPKLATTLVEAFQPVVAIADDGANTAIVDVYASVNGVNKVVGRVKIITEVTGSTFRVGSRFLLFPGSAATYAAGGVTPADASASANTGYVYSPTVDLDAFYTAAGDARANT